MASTADRKPYPAQIDDRAIHTPDRTYAIIAKSNDLNDGYQDFTYKQLARAIHRMSWWLDHTLGKSADFDTLGYIGASDLRYTILYVAALKTHRQVCIPFFLQLVQLYLMELLGTLPFIQQFYTRSTESCQSNEMSSFDCIRGLDFSLACTQARPWRYSSNLDALIRRIHQWWHCWAIPVHQELGGIKAWPNSHTAYLWVHR